MSALTSQHPMVIVEPQNYPDFGLGNHNCRNPDGEPDIWCYTTEIWDFCDAIMFK